MNAEQLLKVYEKISEAPDAIARLRRFVLDLAVRGKLVEQSPADEPASQLLNRIEERKAEILLETGMRKPRKVADMDPAETWAHLPSNWAWTQISNLGFISPRNEADDGVEASFVPMPMIFAEYGVANDHETRPWGEIKKGYTHFAEGDVGLAKITPCFENGKSTVFRNLTGGFGSGTTELHILRPVLVNPDYVVLFLKSPQFIETGIPKMTGTAGQKRVSSEYFTSSPFPLPPLAEQHRIVAKVDELMALCDRLEGARKTREETRDKLTDASLARLTAPDTAAEDFPAHANFALEALPALTTRFDQIKILRQTILNLAVRGKLVEQDPKDEPASELVQSFRTSKLELRRKTGDARIKAAADATPLELRLDLPKGWEVQSFENLFLFIDYRGKTPPKTEAGIPLITAKNVRIRSLNREPREFIAPETFEKWMTRGFPKLGDIFFTTEAPLANACLNDIEEPFALAQRVVCLQPYAEINTRFLVDAMASDLVQEMIDREATGMTAKGIKTAKLKPLALPIPPLAEQHRIVAKVDALMVLCDRLEAALTTTDTTRTRLLEAVLHEALEPSSTQDEIAA